MLLVVAAAWGAPEIVHGAPEDGYPSAVGLGAAGFTLCSGSVLTPRIVLTAAHCSADLPIELIVQLGTAYVGPDPHAPDAELKFVDARVHPGYVPLVSGVGGDLGENDVALLVLAEDAPVAPVWLRTEPLKPNQTEGEAVVSVGYGIDENGEGNVKRSAELTVSYVDPVFLYSFSDQNEGGANICSGDSGGPQYHFEPDGTLVQWAVHSWGDTDCSYESGSTRLDQVSGWILAQVEDVHGTTDRCAIFGAYGDGACDEDCAEPDPDCAPPPDADADAADASAEAGVAEEDGGCGCATGGGGAWALALATLALGRRRAGAR